MSSSGEILWHRQFEWFVGEAIAEASNGSILVAGAEIKQSRRQGGASFGRDKEGRIHWLDAQGIPDRTDRAGTRIFELGLDDRSQDTHIVAVGLQTVLAPDPADPNVTCNASVPMILSGRGPDLGWNITVFPHDPWAEGTVATDIVLVPGNMSFLIGGNSVCLSRYGSRGHCVSHGAGWYAWVDHGGDVDINPKHPVWDLVLADDGQPVARTISDVPWGHMLGEDVEGLARQGQVELPTATLVASLASNGTWVVIERNASRWQALGGWTHSRESGPWAWLTSTGASPFSAPHSARGPGVSSYRRYGPGSELCSKCWRHHLATGREWRDVGPWYHPRVRTTARGHRPVAA